MSRQKRFLNQVAGAAFRTQLLGKLFIGDREQEPAALLQHIVEALADWNVNGHRTPGTDPATETGGNGSLVPPAVIGHYIRFDRERHRAAILIANRRSE